MTPFPLGAIRSTDLTVPAKMYPELRVNGGGRLRSLVIAADSFVVVADRAGCSAIAGKETEVRISATTKNFQIRRQHSQASLLDRGQPLDGNILDITDWRKDGCAGRHRRSEFLLRKSQRLNSIELLSAARTGHPSLHTLRHSLALPLRRQMSSREQQQSRQECPEHQARGQGERSIDFLKIQPRQRQDVAILQDFREQSHDHRRRHDRPGRHFAVRQ